VRADCALQSGDRETALNELAMAIEIFDELGAHEQRDEAINWARDVGLR
jgi:hypothetical protein